MVYMSSNVINHTASRLGVMLRHAIKSINHIMVNKDNNKDCFIT